MAAETKAVDHGFPQAARLKTPAEFQTTFQQGRRIQSAMFRLHVRGETDGGVVAADHRPMGRARLGISVPKRVAPSAVERNRIRRVVREYFRHVRATLPRGDYVLVAQRQAVAASSAALQESLAALWRRALALKPEGTAPTMPIPAPKPADSDPSASTDHQR